VFRVAHRHFDLVIMNPPFTRHGAREGDRTHVHNPAFAAFGADEEEQDRLAERLKEVSRGSSAHGHAGLASYFAELAHRKLAAGGRLALVLPLSSMSGIIFTTSSTTFCSGFQRCWKRSVFFCGTSSDRSGGQVHLSHALHRRVEPMSQVQPDPLPGSGAVWHPRVRKLRPKLPVPYSFVPTLR
jgi:hypothetical protein